MADDGNVICILNNRVLLMSGSAVIGVQCEQKGVENIALGCDNVEC